MRRKYPAVIAPDRHFTALRAQTSAARRLDRTGEAIQPDRRQERPVDSGGFTVSVFTDDAFVRNRHEPNPVPDRLASVGLSLSWTPSQATLARVSYAEALKDAHIVGRRDLQHRGVQFLVK